MSDKELCLKVAKLIAEEVEPTDEIIAIVREHDYTDQCRAIDLHVKAERQRCIDALDNTSIYRLVEGRAFLSSVIQFRNDAREAIKEA